MWKRLHSFYKRLYTRWMMFWTRHAPRSNEHLNDLSIKVKWELDGTYRCTYCSWRDVEWNKSALEWQCRDCGQHYYPDLPVTEKRAFVIPATLWQPKQTTPIPRSISMPLPEQQAVQPPYTPHIFSLEPKLGPYVPGRLLKAVTGPIEMRDGKPCYKNGSRVTTDQFKRIIFPPRDDRRTG